MAAAIQYNSTDTSTVAWLFGVTWSGPVSETDDVLGFLTHTSLVSFYIMVGKSQNI